MKVKLITSHDQNEFEKKCDKAIMDGYIPLYNLIIFPYKFGEGMTFLYAQQWTKVT